MSAFREDKLHCMREPMSGREQEIREINQRTKIGVLTSGGDAPGMNACLRGVVRASLNRGWEVYGIRDAYQGLVEGDDKISPIDWVDVSWNFREGGTFLGSARFVDLIGDSTTARKLKQRALLNLKQRGITCLVVIGGDGSLTGAFDLFNFLKEHASATPELVGMELSIVGIPGSIDNDIAYTDMSIGADTTLNTIVACIDKLRDTATSHKRISIVEVMGRLRGYLAVMSGLASGADQIFIREDRITQDKLNQMLHDLRESFVHGQRAGVVVRSEGAGISTGYLKETIEMLMEPKRDVRETVLGHLQRGGNPSAFEIILAIRMGVQAIRELTERFDEPKMITINDGTITSIPLSECLAKVKTPEFRSELSKNTRNAFRLNRILEATPISTRQNIRYGILTDGSNVSGMNMAIRAVARLTINDGKEILGIKGGFAGLAQGAASAFPFEWSMLEMSGILRRAGTLLGVSGNEALLCQEDLQAIKNQIKALNLAGLIVIGDRRTYENAIRITETIKIPLVGIPAALNCNVPGTDWVIGMDSSVNDLIKGIDRAADAAHVLKKIFIIHIKGNYCSCLVRSAALSGGAEVVIMNDTDVGGEEAQQETISIKIQSLKKIISMGKSFATIIFFSKQAENAEVALKSIREEIVRAGITLDISSISLETSLGGIIPTAFDRILAQRLGEKAFTTLLANCEERRGDFHMVGIHHKDIIATPFKNPGNRHKGICSTSRKAEFDQCIALMSEPGPECIGIGGDITWVDTSNERQWLGQWNCKKCGNTQSFHFNQKTPLCIFCSTPSCHNYGYVRISRRL